MSDHWQTGRAMAAWLMLGAGDGGREGPFDVPFSPEGSRPLFSWAQARGMTDHAGGIQPEEHHLGRARATGFICRSTSWRHALTLGAS
jgi:hypothetical protein